MRYAADEARFQEPDWVSAPDSNTVTDYDVINASKAIAAEIAPLVATMLRVEIGMKPKDFLRADAQGYTFEGGLTEFLQTAISEALDYTGREL